MQAVEEMTKKVICLIFGRACTSIRHRPGAAWAFSMGDSAVLASQWPVNPGITTQIRWFDLLTINHVLVVQERRCLRRNCGHGLDHANTAACAGLVFAASYHCMYQHLPEALESSDWPQYLLPRTRPSSTYFILHTNY